MPYLPEKMEKMLVVRGSARAALQGTAVLIQSAASLVPIRFLQGFDVYLGHLQASPP
jgi:hypothetical protein